ncbi:MAG TPA: bifunctional demethylmenaquinone methyltransferase/2-methoxy-6-polyprenyl-1,4-benzoquinol methylase UbiE [Dehalococcoidia bacterium]|nr:bifunctional demethylmenaquinone methyltransferase/2-methoxy-6-polyprenyl-1,4-benzoquinol methylase UbiE [Dehalococcoidia bacterium]
MTVLTGQAKAAFVRHLFARIAARYDLMNRLITLGRDQEWRRETVALSRPTAGGRAIDVAAGTGDLAIELARYCEQVAAVDFTLEMLVVGRRKAAARPEGPHVHCVGGDALALPFANDTFDCATTGFAMRNVTDIEAAFREMRRVLRPGAWVACLELTRPTSSWVRRLFHVYFYRIVPLAGRLITGDPIAYSYLPNSLTRFLTADQLKATMEAAGLVNVSYRRVNFGTIAVHVGQKA